MGHGDAGRTTNGHPTWGFIPSTCIWLVCRSYRVHPPGNGGPLCIPSCPATALVSFHSTFICIWPMGFESLVFLKVNKGSLMN